MSQSVLYRENPLYIDSAPLDTRHTSVKLKKKTLELRITPFSTNLMTLTHSVHGLSKTILVKKQHAIMGELFPGAEYIVAVRGISVRRGQTEYSHKPYVLKVTKNLTSQGMHILQVRMYCMLEKVHPVHKYIRYTSIRHAGF